MGKRRKRLKRRQKWLNELIDEAEGYGALNAIQASAYRDRARSVNILLILELISIIAEIIRKWIENRNA